MAKIDSIRPKIDEVISAIGRKPMVNDMGFEYVNIKHTDDGHIISDEYQETGVQNIYALGDVCGYWELTPVAIAAGRRLSDRIFGNMPNAKLDYTNIPTVVFTHPPVGTIGDTEEEAIEKYGDQEIVNLESLIPILLHIIQKHKIQIENNKQNFDKFEKELRELKKKI